MSFVFVVSRFVAAERNAKRTKFKYSVLFMSADSFHCRRYSSLDQISNRRRVNTQIQNARPTQQNQQRCKSSWRRCRMPTADKSTYLVCKLSIKRSNVISSNRTKSWTPTSLCCTIFVSLGIFNFVRMFEKQSKFFCEFMWLHADDDASCWLQTKL